MQLSDKRGKRQMTQNNVELEKIDEIVEEGLRLLGLAGAESFTGKLPGEVPPPSEEPAAPPLFNIVESSSSR